MRIAMFRRNIAYLFTKNEFLEVPFNKLISVNVYKISFKLFALEFAFTFACLVFGRQAFTLLNH
ncbi:MAG: hypothetical protein LBP59_08590 [Planctomycetaceae bacterium]|nr:hypothetical protein [Planctomycetaceae bacterium]